MLYLSKVKVSTISNIRSYYHLIKPGIVRGNAITAIAGYLFATHSSFNLVTFLAMLIGTSLVIACACVYNNVIDRDIDAHMARTKKRAMVQKNITIPAALTYGTVLGIAGFSLLAVYTNALTVILGATALVAYVGLYTPIKRLSVHGTLVGSISGAVPPMAGYTAATGRFDGATVLLGLMMVCWQMPHFYAIAIFRSKDYAAAKIPVLPLVQGMTATRRQIIAYTILFGVSTLGFTVFDYSGYSIAVVGLVLTFIWLKKGFAKQVDDIKWARGMFGLSLLVLLSMSVVLSLNSLLP